jgi:phosphatidylglycerol---prolipoprotein diacylglyceryl transferase
MTWWQHLPEKMSPTIFGIGSFQLRWYGMMYILAFATVYLLVMARYKLEKPKIDLEVAQNWFMYAILGVILGGRIGYVLFYDPGMILTNPLGILLPVDVNNGFRFTGLAGMSYHGGVIGVALLSMLYVRQQKIGFWALADLVVPAIPLGYTFGRLGNFINGELYGRVTDVAWGMYFPDDFSQQLRHPSQLYEALFEGIALFALLWMIRNNKKLTHLMFPIYLIGYGVARFFIEFVRQPDAHLGTIFGPFSMGQILCFAMIAAGLGLIALIRRQPRQR